MGRKLPVFSSLGNQAGPPSIPFSLCHPIIYLNPPRGPKKKKSHFPLSVPWWLSSGKPLFGRTLLLIVLILICKSRTSNPVHVEGGWGYFPPPFSLLNRSFFLGAILPPFPIPFDLEGNNCPFYPASEVDFSDWISRDLPKQGYPSPCVMEVGALSSSFSLLNHSFFLGQCCPPPGPFDLEGNNYPSLQHASPFPNWICPDLPKLLSEILKNF